jgi:glycosyltransferase involved in cell wall biosynthesis
VLGGAKTPAEIMGFVPRNWVVHEFGKIHPRDFLAEVDVWIYFAHPDWVESFGRTIIEAMAVGIPVVLPEVYRPLFKEAAIYASPETAVAIARSLYSDSTAYTKQVDLARDFVRKNFSYESHVERLRNLDN